MKQNECEICLFSWFFILKCQGAEGTTRPHRPRPAPSGVPHLGTGPHFSPPGAVSLAQRHRSRTRLQLPTALPYLAAGPAEPGPPTGLQPGPALACPCPGRCRCLGWGCPAGPGLPLSGCGGTGPGCQALPYRSLGPPCFWPHGGHSLRRAPVLNHKACCSVIEYARPTEWCLFLSRLLVKPLRLSLGL